MTKNDKILAQIKQGLEEKHKGDRKKIKKDRGLNRNNREYVKAYNKYSASL